MLAYVQALWIYPGFFRRQGNTYKLCTGGWSGHEDLIRALQDNRSFWVAATTAAIAGVTAIDVLASQQVSAAQGRTRASSSRTR